jgi:hypothetical protein
MSKDTADLEILLEQYRILSDDIRAVESMSEKMLSVGFTMISALIVYCLKENIREVYFASTPAYLGLLLFMSSQYNTVFWKGGHKRAIEKQVNLIAGRNILFWEELAEHGRKRFTFQNAMFGAFLLLTVVAVFVFSTVMIYKIFGIGKAATYSAVSVFLFAALVLSVLDGAKRFRESLRVSQVFFASESDLI